MNALKEIESYVSILENRIKELEMKQTYELSFEDDGLVEKLNYSNCHLMANYLWNTDAKLAEALLEELLAQRTLDAMVSTPEAYTNSKEGGN